MEMDVFGGPQRRIAMLRKRLRQHGFGNHNPKRARFAQGC